MPESADWSLNQKVDNVAAQVQTLQGKVDVVGTNVDAVKAAVDAQALYNLASFAQAISGAGYIGIATAADGVVQTLDLIPDAVGTTKRVVLIGVKLGYELSGSPHGPAYSVPRSVVEVAIGQAGGAGYVAEISPAQPSVGEWLPPGAYKFDPGADVQVTFLGAYGAGIQYFTVIAFYYLSAV